MPTGSNRVRSFGLLTLGFLAIEAIGSLMACRGKSVKNAGVVAAVGSGTGAPSPVVVTSSPGPAEATKAHDKCAPAPSSSLVVNVRKAAYGAKGDGVTDDTDAIQRAVNAVAGTGGTVMVPDGTYMVNAVAQNAAGIRLGSKMTMKLSSGAVLKAIPNASGNYAILAVSFASHVTIVGGTLLGERGSHTGTDGEWGMGLSINNSAHVVVQDVTAKECWGDGFYVTSLSSDVTLCGVVADHNRRQGLSVTSVEGLVVRNSTFKNSVGTAPECGIDLEPNDSQIINNAQVTGCTITNNVGGGISCGFNSAFGGPTAITNITITNNAISGNGAGTRAPGAAEFPSGVYVANAKGGTALGNGVVVSSNTISGNYGSGIAVFSGTTHASVIGNTVTGTLLVSGNTAWTGNGIEVDGSPNTNVTNNTVTGNATNGIWLMRSDPTVVISGNTVTGNAGIGIQAGSKTSMKNSVNNVYGNGKTP
jgi:parallel beta-helix repeat protein